MIARLSIAPLLFVAIATQLLRADIYRTDNGALISGTEAIEPGPGVELANRNTESHNLRFANFCCDIDLRNANFASSWLDNAHFVRANLTDANLSGAVVTGATFVRTKWTFSQLESTASYQAKNLQGINLSSSVLTGWDFSGQNLTDAKMSGSKLTGADLTGALVTGANFVGSVITHSQLESTASYQAKNLQGIDLSSSDLTGWDFSGQNLTDAAMYESKLTSADLTGANLTGVFLIRGTLSNADLRGANLTNGYLFMSTLSNADLRGANLKNAYLRRASMDSAAFDSDTVYNQWTRFPDNFDPVAAQLTLMEASTGDFDANDILDIRDVDLLLRRIIRGRPSPFRPILGGPDAMFDVNTDSVLGNKDLHFWVHNLKHTWLGDANLDGEFNSGDLVAVFEAGEYEDGSVSNSSWATGDWNGDGEFSTSDLVTAFTDGGYEQGPRGAVNAVPEPGSTLMLMAGLIGIIIRRQRIFA